MATKAKPNVLLIICDDLGADVLKFVGDQAIAQAPGTKKYRLPNLSKLLKNGINFTQTWAHPVCSATRATVFTGLHPWQTGVGFASFLLPDPSSPTTALIGLNLDDTGTNLTGLNPTGVIYEMPTETADGHRIETYADVLARAGYQCSFFGKWDQGYMINFNNNVADPKTIRENGPIHRGWHHFEGVFGGGVDPNASAFPDLDPRLYWTWKKEFQDKAKLPTNHGERTYQTTSERVAAGGYAYATADSIYSARDWIKQNAGTPWCTTLALHAPHYPYHVPPEGTYTIDEIRGTAAELNQVKKNGVEEQAKFVAMVEAMDHYLGKFLEDPDIQDQLKETIIIFLGDNGSPGSVVDLDNDLIKEAKRSVYLNGVYVPMVIADGKAVLGEDPFYLHPDDLDTDNFQMVQVSDIFQTIIDLGGGTTPTGYSLDTSSLIPYLERKTTHPDPRLYNFGQYFINPGIVPKPTQRAAITDGAYKLSYQGDGSDYGGRGISAARVEKAQANHKVYEFSELLTDPNTGLQVERYINDYNHPKAQELWSALTDDNGRYYAELDNLGKKFPPLPTDTTPLTRLVASDSYTQRVGSFPPVPNRLVIGDKTASGEEMYRAKITFDLSQVGADIKEATLYLCPVDLEAAKAFIEPLVNADSIYPLEAGDASKRIDGKMGGDGRIEYDVTGIIQGWLNDPTSDNGFRVLMYPTSDAQEEGDVPRPMEFHNHYNSIFGPMLVIEEETTSPPDPTESTGQGGQSQGNFYTTDGRGGISLLRENTDWRQDWSHIIPGNFGGSGDFTDLLFYDQRTGQASFYTTDGQGRLSLLRQHTDWRSTWSHIIPGNFSGSGFTDLLLYDPKAGHGNFYTTDGQGGISLLRQHTGWWSTWRMIIPGNFGGNNFTDLLLFDPTSHQGFFFTTDGQGGLSLLRRHSYWWINWSHIIPGNFGGSGFTDLLFYEQRTRQGFFYTTDGQGNVSMLSRHTGWRSTWSQIIPGNFGGNNFTDLLLYDPTVGHGSFYATDGHGGVSSLREHTDWQQDLSLIVPGNFGGSNSTDLLFYKPST